MSAPDPILGLSGVRRFRVTARLAVELFILAVLITAASGWIAIALVDDNLRKQQNEQLYVMSDGIEAVVQVEAEEVIKSLERVDDYLDLDSDLVVGLLLHLEERTDSQLSGPEGEDAGSTSEPRAVEALADPTDAAARLMSQHRLDYLEILNDGGQVLSSGPRRERVGVTDQRLLSLPAGRPELRLVDLGDESKLVIVSRLDRVVGARSLVLVGGRSVDKQFVNRVAGRDAAVLFVPGPEDEPPRVVESNVLGKLAGEERTALRETATVEPAAMSLAGRRWILKRAPVGEVAWVVVGVDLSRYEELHGQLVEAFVYLGLGVGLFAALSGVWIAQRTARPVRELVTALDSIARGEADYSFSVRAQDEAQELAASFSRLHRALEDQRRRSMAAERVAAWREVARHVAHEVKNPLAPIRLTVENLLRARTQAPERFDGMFREGMTTILEEVQQLSRMVSEFAEFARLPLPVRRSVDLDELIDRVVELYASEPEVDIRKEVAPDLRPFELDPDQISRALKNVLGNAIEAAREGGAAGDVKSPLVEIRISLAGEMAEIEVEDNGPGLSAEAERRLFEPYFTTKTHGTGLGMALTYRIVVEHGGVIFAENRSGSGARVVVRLPLVAPEPRFLAAQRDEAVG